MAIQIQLRQGTTAEHNTFTGAVGELTYDTTNKTLRVHDGATVGGKVIVGTRLVTTPIDVDHENTTGVRIINALGNTNLPMNVYGALNVYSNENFDNGALRVYQTFQPDIFNDLYFRKWDGTYWSAWERSVKFSEAFGVGQTWQYMTSSRVGGTTYTNSSTRPIMLSIAVRDNGQHGGAPVTLYVNSSIAIRLDDVFGGGGGVGGYVQIVTVVPAGQTYRLDAAGNFITFWGELR